MEQVEPGLFLQDAGAEQPDFLDLGQRQAGEVERERGRQIIGKRPRPAVEFDLIGPHRVDKLHHDQSTRAGVVLAHAKQGRCRIGFQASRIEFLGALGFLGHGERGRPPLRDQRHAQAAVLVRIPDPEDAVILGEVEVIEGLGIPGDVVALELDANPPRRQLVPPFPVELHPAPGRGSQESLDGAVVNPAAFLLARLGERVRLLRGREPREVLRGGLGGVDVKPGGVVGGEDLGPPGLLASQIGHGEAGVGRLRA